VNIAPFMHVSAIFSQRVVNLGKSLTSEALETVLIDVTEQEIERPKQGQKEYYSGKKKDIR
jgi:hypothetical protein